MIPLPPRSVTYHTSYHKILHLHTQQAPHAVDLTTTSAHSTAKGKETAVHTPETPDAIPSANPDQLIQHLVDTVQSPHDSNDDTIIQPEHDPQPSNIVMEHSEPSPLSIPPASVKDVSSSLPEVVVNKQIPKPRPIPRKQTPAITQPEFIDLDSDMDPFGVFSTAHQILHPTLLMISFRAQHRRRQRRSARHPHHIMIFLSH